MAHQYGPIEVVRECRVQESESVVSGYASVAQPGRASDL